jgi:hypothetical protein
MRYYDETPSSIFGFVLERGRQIGCFKEAGKWDASKISHDAKKKDNLKAFEISC